MDIHVNNFRDLAVEEFDTRTLLAHAARAGDRAPLRGFPASSTSTAHHYETESFDEIAEYIEDPVHAPRGQVSRAWRVAASRSADGSYQEIGGRITRYPRRAEREGAADAASRHHADRALDGRDGRRRRLPVPDADAEARA